VRVARLAAADVPRYRALMLHAYEAAADAFTTTAEERAAEPESWWIKRIADPDALGFALGAFMGEELVGTVTLEFSAKPKTRHKARVIGMFVSESQRGRGAGRALVQAALAAAASRQVLVVTLTVTEGNTSAIALYESCGFKTFGIEPMAIATPGGLKAKVHMWVQLPVIADVPSPIDLCDPKDAEEWAATAMAKRPWRADFFARFAEQVSALSGKRVLELGSGAGFLAEVILRSVSGVDYTLLDFSAAMHDIAIERLGELARNARFIRADFRKPDWVDGLPRFDAVVTMQAVHELRHKCRAEALHRQVRGLLAPGGAYLVCDH